METGDAEERMVKVGAVMTFYCPLSCSDVEGGEEIGDLLFQNWMTSETITIPLALRSGSLVLEWGVSFTRPSVLVKCPAVSNMSVV